MHYLGGKGRIAKQIVSVMDSEREHDMIWVEPFMGSGKVISLIKGRRIGSDANYEVIELFKAIRRGWEPPDEVSREFYHEVQNNKDKYPSHLRAFINIGCSFGGIRWNSYAENSRGDNFALRCKNSLMKLNSLMSDVELYSVDYRSLHIPNRALIYCDPPYANTTGSCKYIAPFNHEEFYAWCRDKVAEGHYLFVSEYSMPDDFELAWSQDVLVSPGVGNKLVKTERLYRLHKKPPFSLKMY